VRSVQRQESQPAQFRPTHRELVNRKDENHNEEVGAQGGAQEAEGARGKAATAGDA
jgi:hypothetical protein